MGFMYIYRGMAYMIGNSQWASAENLGDFKNFALGKVLGINNAVLLCLSVILFSSL